MTNDQGSVVVEMALVIPLLLLVVMALVEVGVAARTQVELVNAAREGAREAAINPDPSRAAAAVRRALGDLGDGVRIDVERAHIVGGVARVGLELRHRIATPVFGGFEVRLRASSTMRVER